MYNPIAHNSGFKGILQNLEYDESIPSIENIGWTLGNDCPYRCNHCYSMSARNKGQNLSKQIVNKIIAELVLNKIKTVNLGGNEPIFTNGLDHKESLLPYIIEKLVENNIAVGLTTSGISLILLEKHYKEAFLILNDVDVSFDSPIKEEHNKNRGANLFADAIKSLELCRSHQIEHSLIMCAMNWNFTEDRIKDLISLASIYGSNIRINPIKTVEQKHLAMSLSAAQYYKGFELLMKLCDPIDLGEPPLATVCGFSGAKGCPCGRTSFRIHSITPDGKIPVSPCVYLHDYKVGDLVNDSLKEIISSNEFKMFRIRNKHPELVEGCSNCNLIEMCRSGCSARAYLYNSHLENKFDFFQMDPFCPAKAIENYNFPHIQLITEEVKLVHKDYLCTWIGKPKKK